MSKDVTRNDKGQFVKGQSGNPAGRRKGLKNYITEERLLLEAALREYAGSDKNKNKLLKAIDRLIDISVNGEDKVAVNALKVLLDKVMPAASSQNEEDGNNGKGALTIVFASADGQAGRPVEILEGEATEIPQEK